MNSIQVISNILKNNIGTSIFICWFLFFLIPKALFDQAISPVLLDKDHELLGAKIAEDGQWHFHESDSISTKFKKALLQYEDRNFYNHIGIDPRGLGRAIIFNLKNTKRQGGSTLSMQIARMSSSKGKRTYFKKIKEILIAIRLELKYSKEKILRIYASNAPFGGNIIGIEAASWRYFGKTHHGLSWAESAMLAVLPNAPGLIHPGRSRDRLKQKRDRLLFSMQEANIISLEDYQLAILEPLPKKPKPLPQEATHLLDLLIKQNQFEERFVSTIDGELQAQLNEIAKQYGKSLRNAQINNLAILVTDLEHNKVIAYVGNTPDLEYKHQPYVDLIQAPRSSGSVLKPLLFAKAIDNAKISPYSLLRDVPNNWGGYTPLNYSKKFEGLVPADESLFRSLNLPFVELLHNYEHQKFLRELKELNFKTINRSADDYGLSLILGGAEITLWDLAKVYGGMAKTLKNFDANQGKYIPSYYASPLLLQNGKNPKSRAKKHFEHFSAASIWYTFDALRSLKRPGTEGEWQYFSSAQQIAWKTGTSHGFKDAWSIGVNGRYLVGVWVGNADGEGREGLVGLQTAAPLFFKVFNTLPNQVWYDMPLDELFDQEVCAESGYKPTEKCPIRKILLPKQSEHLPFCKNHQWISCTADSLFRADKDCEENLKLTKVSYFIPSPKEAYFMNQGGRAIPSLPPFHPQCQPTEYSNSIEFIYPPSNNFELYIPRTLNNSKSDLVFSAVHASQTASLFWHLDDQYLGETIFIHDMAFSAKKGKHTMMIKDNKGNEKRVRFEVLEE
jgi:penicillin-binding protein 1C